LLTSIVAVKRRARTDIVARVCAFRHSAAALEPHGQGRSDARAGFINAVVRRRAAIGS
jgi:hypothetical protein